MTPSSSEGLFPFESIHYNFFFFLGVRSLEDITSLNYPADAFGATLFSLAAQMCQRGADLWVVRAGPSATLHLKQAYFSFPASLMDHRWANVVSLIFNLVYFTSMLTIFRSTLVLSGGLSLPFCVSAYLLVVSWYWCLNGELYGVLKSCPLSGLLLWSLMLQYWLGNLVQSPDVLEKGSGQTVYLNLIRLGIEEPSTNPKVEQSSVFRQ